jgi:hypothetical protein
MPKSSGGSSKGGSKLLLGDLSEDPEWADLQPEPVVEDQGKVIAIQYTAAHKQALGYFRAVLKKVRDVCGFSNSNSQHIPRHNSNITCSSTFQHLAVGGCWRRIKHEEEGGGRGRVIERARAAAEAAASSMARCSARPVAGTLA